MSSQFVFVFAVLVTSQVCFNRVHTMYLEGSLQTTETWSFLARFCFLSHKGQLHYFFTFPPSYQPMQLLMYYDEPNQWPAVYKTGLTCGQMTSPPHILVENNQGINLDVSEYWSGCGMNEDNNVQCEATRNFESSRARWWYLAISRCQNSSLQGINIEYKIHMTNGANNDVMFVEFSADEFYILQVDIACLCIMLFLLLLASISAYKLKKRLMFHTSFKIYLTSMCFYIFYLFIECIAYGQFANTGVPNDALKTFGHVSEVISVLVFVLMLLLMGKGFTITRGKISTGGSIKIAIFMTLYAVTYAVLFFYQAMFFDPGLVLYAYESPPGYGILVLRCLAWIYFSYACFFTVKHYPEKSKFYYPFWIFYTIWFLIGPLFVIIAYIAWPKYARATIVNGVDNCIAILAHTFLLVLTCDLIVLNTMFKLFLTRPSNTNKNFPFHVRTSQIGFMRDAEDLDNFPPYPYAPSNNFLSDNGPNFSNLFGVKEQEMPSSEAANGSLPPVVRQSKNGQVPMDRFPHENGDAAEPSAPVEPPQQRNNRSDPFVTSKS